MDTTTLVAQHLPLVDRLVDEAMSRVPTSVHRDELRLVGRLALARAADAWEGRSRQAFGRMAEQWIRTTLADELRAAAWLAAPPYRGTGLAAEVRLARAIAALPDRLRRVTEAYFLEQRPVAEVAAALGVTPEDVARLRAQALVLLRDPLGEALDAA